MLRIGLLGFGKTGKEVARELLLDKSVKLVCVFKYHDDYLVGQEVGPLLGLEASGVTISLSQDYEKVIASQKPDVIIDFAAKRGILNYIDATIRSGTNLVICSTGYTPSQIDIFRSKAENIGILWAPNITDGINILAKLGEFVKSNWPEADISIVETHHSGKKDISGTALKLAERLSDTEDIRVGRTSESSRVDNEIVIHKIRLGGVIGKHEIVFGNPYQTITLSHTTISRLAFGKGAIRGAHWIYGKKGFYTMDDIISFR